MSNRNTLPAKHKTCIHLRPYGACSDPQCEHYDKRAITDRVAQLFGQNSNSAAAAELHRTDLVEYERLRKLAVERGMLAPRLSDRAKALQVDLDAFK